MAESVKEAVERGEVQIFGLIFGEAQMKNVINQNSELKKEFAEVKQVKFLMCKNFI